MSENHAIAERLRRARIAAGYSSAEAAAQALGLPPQSYRNNENGSRGIRSGGKAERLAKFFRVSLEWLIAGRGDMYGERMGIPIVGLVGAGSSVEPVGDTAAAEPPGNISLPEGQHLAGLVVRGDSQWPRFLEGEIILFDTRTRSPAELVNQYAVVDLDDGRRMIKKLARTGRVGHWTLLSHNREPETVDNILAAYEVKGVLMSS